MQLLCDAISVLGARHGLVFNPIQRHCRIIRWDRWHEQKEVHIKCGARLDGKEYLFPLTPGGELFPFLDQRTTPCTVRWIGIHPESGLKASLTAATPFRPRDLDFSSTPALAFRLTVEKLPGAFRWTPLEEAPREVELFFEVSGPGTAFTANGADSFAFEFTSTLRWHWTEIPEALRSPVEESREKDLILSPNGSIMEHGFSKTAVAGSATLDVFWCAWSPQPMLEVKGARCPFLYTERFSSLDAVGAWAREYGEAIWENAAAVDAKILHPENSASLNHLLAYTLHSWLINTWLARRPDGRLWFSVWEGNCYFHSTVDVEFTQSPFYLAVWPELLEIQLDFWPEFSKNGSAVLGADGGDTLFLSHDVGGMSGANFQNYPHDMPVEETANWLILAFAHWRRTGSDKVLKKYTTIIRSYLRFIEACSTDGDGVPVLGAPNTIDDGSPAIQFGTKQIYLAVKALASYTTGAAMLRHLGDEAAAEHYEALANKTRARIQEDGWKDDHFIVTLEKSGTLRDPWKKTETHYAEVPGWDAPHIYTTNALTVLDMVGFDTGLNAQKLKTDLKNATARCLREYGCVHTDFQAEVDTSQLQAGLAGASVAPGWIAMNILRDLSALYRGLDFDHLLDRYWEWQATTNSQEPKLFFETFSGNNLSFYPRGLVIYGIYDARARRIVDRVTGKFSEQPSVKPAMDFSKIFAI